MNRRDVLLSAVGVAASGFVNCPYVPVVKPPVAFSRPIVTHVHNPIRSGPAKIKKFVRFVVGYASFNDGGYRPYEACKVNQLHAGDMVVIEGGDILYIERVDGGIVRTREVAMNIDAQSPFQSYESAAKTKAANAKFVEDAACRPIGVDLGVFSYGTIVPCPKGLHNPEWQEYLSRQRSEANSSLWQAYFTERESAPSEDYRRARAVPSRPV